MEPSAAIRMVGSNFSKAKEEEINIWYDTDHVPFVMRGEARWGERYLQMGEPDKVHPKCLAMYGFESEKVLNDYLSGPIPKEAFKDRSRHWTEESGDFTNVWRVNYRRIAKRGSDERSLAFRITGTNVPKGAKEDDFNDWYTNDHMVFALRDPAVIRAERYQRIGDDEDYPKYLAIYRFENEKTLNQAMGSWFGKMGVPERRTKYPDSVWDRRWYTNYKMASKQVKDLVVL